MFIAVVTAMGQTTVKAIFVRSGCPADLTKVNDLVVKEESDTETDKSESAESAAEPEVKCEKCV